MDMRKQFQFFTEALILILLAGISNINGQWNKHFIEQDLPSATHLFIADIDGDGDLDVAATAYRVDLVAYRVAPAYRVVAAYRVAADHCSES